MSERVREHLITLVVVLGLIGWLVYSSGETSQDRDLLRQNQIASCERGNLLRAEHNDTARALRTFMEIAAQAREAAAQHAPNAEREEIDTEAAAQYRQLAARVRIVPVPDCEEAVDPL